MDEGVKKRKETKKEKKTKGERSFRKGTERLMRGKNRCNKQEVVG